MRTLFHLYVVPGSSADYPSNAEIADALEEAGIPVGSYEADAQSNGIAFILMPRRGEGKLCGKSVPVLPDDAAAIQQVLVDLAVPAAEVRVPVLK